MLSRNTVASRAGLHRSASINSVSAPCRVHKKCAANEGDAGDAGDAGDQKVEPFNKVCSLAARDLFLALTVSLVGLFSGLQRGTHQTTPNNTATATAQRMKMVFASSSDTQRPAMYLSDSWCRAA